MALLLITVTLVPSTAAWEPAQEKDVNERLIRGIASAAVSGLGDRAKAPAWVEVKVGGTPYAVFVKDKAVQSVERGSAPEEPVARVSLGSKAVATTLYNAYDKRNTANLLIDDNLARVSFKEPNTGLWADIKNVPQRGKSVPLKVGTEVSFLGHTGHLEEYEGRDFLVQLGEDRYVVNQWGGIRSRLPPEQVEQGAQEAASSLDALGEDDAAEPTDPSTTEPAGDEEQTDDGETDEGRDETARSKPVDNETVMQRARSLGMDLQLNEHWSGEKVVELAKKGTFKMSDKHSREQGASAASVIADFAKATGLADAEAADDQAVARVQEVLGNQDLASKAGKENRQKVAQFVKDVLQVEEDEEMKDLPPFEEKDQVLATGLALAVTILEKSKSAEDAEEGDADAADPVLQSRIRMLSALLHRLQAGQAETTEGGEDA